MLYRTSAPGSLMIIGEYAVTQGSPCLVAAINQRIHVILVPRSDNTVMIYSSLAHHTTHTSQLDDHPKLRFIMACLKQYALPSGCDIHIYADFSSQLGLGSSAAVTAALCHALAQWCNVSLAVDSLWETGMRVIQDVQGAGSGADLAASCQGGLIAFKKDPLMIQVMPHTPEITALYSGTKQSTSDALKKKDMPNTWNLQMTQLSEEAIEHAKQAQWTSVAKCMEQAHTLLCERGVCSEPLASLINLMQGSSTLIGEKISGAGFGDCVIALGSLKDSQPLNLQNTAASLKRQLPLSITQEGVMPC